MKNLSLALISLFLILQFTAFSQPKIQIEGNDTYDWGKIDPKGKPLTAKVKIYNKGTETLKITKVKPGCGCTTAPLDKNDIEPNDFATLSISLNVSNDGPVHKSIKITSNDPASPDKNLSLKANIVRPIGLSRKYVNFNNLVIGKESSAQVVIKNNTSKDVKIKDIIVEPKDLKVNIKKNTKIPANKDLTLEVKITPKNSSNISGKITLKTDNKDMESIDISVWGSFPQKSN